VFHPEQINWLAVLAATVAHQVIGFLWYGPLFGKMWMRAIGLNAEQVGSGTSSIIIASLAALVMAASMLTPIKPLDGAAIAKAGAAGASVAAVGLGALALFGIS